METLAWILLLIFVIYTSHQEYRNGGKSFFFEDTTEIEKIKRQNQYLEEKIKYIKLNKELKELKSKNENQNIVKIVPYKED